MFIVYKFIKSNLKDIWNTVRLSIRDITQIGIELVECVENIHSTGYIHTDIKLYNVMIGSENQVFLIDYGCA